jgi:PAS domain S-box-containing protein
LSKRFGNFETVAAARKNVSMSETTNEKELRSTIERYRALVEGISDWIWEVDRFGNYTYANPQVESLLGYRPEEVVGRSAFEFMHADEAKRVGAVFAKIARRAQPFSRLENTCLHKSGREVVMESSGVPLIDADGKLSGYRGIDRDITDRKLATRAIRERQARLDSIFRAAPIGIGVVVDRVLKEVNQQICDIVGYSAKELINQSARILYPTEAEYQYVGEEKYRQIHDKGWGTVESTWRRKDGVEIDVLLSSAPIDPDDHSVGVTFTVLDITERKQADRTLRLTQYTVEHSGDAVYWIDEHGRFVHVNEAACTSLGYARDELLSLSVGDIDPQVPHEKWPDQWAELHERQNTQFKSRHRTKGGRVFPVEISASLVPFEGNEYVCAFARDVTERTKAEEDLVRAQALLTAAIEQSPTGIIIADAPDAKVRSANAAALAIYGGSPTGGKPAHIHERADQWEIFHPNRQPFAFDELPLTQAVLTGKTSRNIEAVIHRADGEDRWVLANASPVRSPDGEVIAGIVVFTDISGRRKAQKALRESEEKFRTIVESIPLGMYMYELQAGDDLVLVDANPAADRILGVKNAQFLGKTIEEAFPPLAGTEIPKRYRAAARSGIAWRTDQIDYQDERIQGAFEVHAFQTEPQRMVAAFADVTERKKAELALRESEENYRSIFNGINEAIVIYDPETGRVVDVNTSTLDMFGITREEALRWQEHFLPGSPKTGAAQRILTLLRKAVDEGPQLFEWQVRLRDGRMLRVDVTLKMAVIGGGNRVMAVIRDITERTLAEEKLRNMESRITHVGRLSAMGELVAGVAHEINQPLYSIANFAKACRNVLATEDKPNLDEIREWSDQIAHAATRAGEIIRRVRGFVRRTETHRDGVSVSDIVDDATQLVQFQARRRQVTVRVAGDASAPLVRADRVQIQQVLVNLLTNAFEAIDDADSTVREVNIDWEVRETKVVVSVADTGPGLASDKLNTVFDAFVTTKAEGLGMGLAISRTIVDAHHGRLWVSRNHRGGATFFFTLPIHATEQEHVE